MVLFAVFIIHVQVTKYWCVTQLFTLLTHLFGLLITYVCV